MHPARPRTATHRAHTLAAALGAAALVAAGLVASTSTPAEAAIGDVIWSQEFNGSAGSAPDSAVWNYDTGAGGWGNAELQNYTTSRNNSALDGQGNLVITARREGDGSYTSARLQSNDKVEVKYGRVEARIQIPRGQGIWPAFWMLGGDFPQNAWPSSRRDRHHGERRQGTAPHLRHRARPRLLGRQRHHRRVPAPAELVVRRRVPHLRRGLEARLDHVVRRRRTSTTRSRPPASAATRGCSTSRSSSSSTSPSAASGPATPTARRSSRSR